MGGGIFGQGCEPRESPTKQCLATILNLQHEHRCILIRWIPDYARVGVWQISEIDAGGIVMIEVLRDLEKTSAKLFL